MLTRSVFGKSKEFSVKLQVWQIWNTITMTRGGYSRRRHASPTIAEAGENSARVWIGAERLLLSGMVMSLKKKSNRGIKVLLFRIGCSLF